MKTTLLIMLAVVLVGCGNSDDDNKVEPSFPKPNGVYFYQQENNTEVDFDFRPDGVLKLTHRGPSNAVSTGYRWHMEEDLIIAAWPEGIKGDADYPPAIFRTEENGELWYVGWTDDEGRHFDPPGSVESIRMRRR